MGLRAIAAGGGGVCFVCCRSEGGDTTGFRSGTLARPWPRPGSPTPPDGVALPDPESEPEPGLELLGLGLSV